MRYLGIPKRSFYNWYHKYSVGGLEALRSKPSGSPHTWNRIPDTLRALAVELALEHPEITARELSVKLLKESGLFISESSYYRILRAAGLLERIEHDFVWAANEYKHKTQFPNEMWQTDFTYFKVKGFGWYYLCTVLDDYSRYIIHWELCSSMSAQDVARSIDQAMLKAGLTHKNAPKLLSDNGPCYIANALKEHLSTKFNMKHIQETVARHFASFWPDVLHISLITNIFGMQLTVSTWQLNQPNKLRASYKYILRFVATA